MLTVPAAVLDSRGRSTAARISSFLSPDHNCTSLMSSPFHEAFQSPVSLSTSRRSLRSSLQPCFRKYHACWAVRCNHICAYAWTTVCCCSVDESAGCCTRVWLRPCTRSMGFHGLNTPLGCCALHLICVHGQTDGWLSVNHQTPTTMANHDMTTEQSMVGCR